MESDYTYDDRKDQKYWDTIELWWKGHKDSEYPWHSALGLQWIAKMSIDWDIPSYIIETDFSSPRFWYARKFGFRQEFSSAWYFITLTCIDDGPEKLISAYTKIVQSQMYGIDKYIMCWELTKAGKPHIHLLVHCTKSTPKKRDLQKFNHGYHVDMKRVKGDECVRVIQYMKKQQQDGELINYLKKHSLVGYTDASKIQEEPKTSQSRVG